MVGYSGQQTEEINAEIKRLAVRPYQIDLAITEH